MKFYRYIENFIDAQEYHRILLNDESITYKIGLAKVIEANLGVAVCKKKQISNWELRPLSLSQMHYAALDAQILT